MWRKKKGLPWKISKKKKESKGEREVYEKVMCSGVSEKEEWFY